MNHPHSHNPLAPAFAFAAVVATAVTLGVAVVVPSQMTVQPVDATALAQREANPAEVAVHLGSIDVVAARPVASGDRAAVFPPALVTTRQPG